MATPAAARINFRTDAQTKQSAEELFDALGLDMSTALNMFLKQAVREQALPIRPALAYIPNAQTARVIEDTQKVIDGEKPETGAVFDDAPQAAQFLDSLS
ncbi:type II toxin-antitoxin system RelB/DinJ family antitoxin [Mobiluncus mulieris]|nr:type II toxin-antitoxin system RelB/DinJ family antitoxin [Mobiluncus mulieris]MBB5845433.1 DNA-damage-inducible protein J [Mobiluncus mulieris]MCU9976597.1 type II toxin-antitoxin system RelB/DinJ family antitoxin [Mobiluncus mulieris]MCV0012285.1 type II toxin-antitoxin system RelB/DinJ family antitoxin [Mobiluncus mulieris]MCV0014467.1 type II toxin-antitoxin system RelB/DinJ family antitoxin [Mobiluncus mulieris]NMW60525.1 type II toxin-antitoxin system RelB/DinJ family antitoxin [Mobil